MPNEVIALWSGKAPGALGERPEDIPTLTLFPPSGKPNGAAMLVFPGGGYEALMDYEGEAYARWLADAGYYGMVVQYRLFTHHYNLPEIVGDGLRALRWARANAARLGYDPRKIGVIGSSAGGHMCASASVRWDAGDPASADPLERVSSRPDLAVLCYPAISIPWDDDSADWIAKQAAVSAAREYLDTATRVTAQTPPAFLFHTFEDQMVPVEQSMRYARALDREKIPFELHVYQKGPHGVALGNGHPWTLECLRWLGEQFEG